MSRSDLVLAPRCKRGHFPAITGTYTRRRLDLRTGTAYIGHPCRLCRIDDSMKYWRDHGGRSGGPRRHVYYEGATHCQKGHALSEVGVYSYTTRTGYVMTRCRECKRENWRKWRRTHKAA